MPNYVITESVGNRVERVNNYDDLEKHHPSSGREPGREYLTIDGELEEVRTRGRTEPHVKKDFIVDPPTIPSPVSGFVRSLGDQWNTVQIVDAEGNVLAQSLHMARGSQPPNGSFIEYGQPLGRMGDVGSPGSIHAHVEAPSRVFEQYINDMASGRIQPGEAPTGRTNPAQGGNMDELADGLLRLNDRGPKVEELQRVLTERGFDTQGTDGKFGQNTHNAVEAFQRANGLPVDGVVGQDTARALGISLTQDATAPTAPAPTTPTPTPPAPTTPEQPTAGGRVPGGPNDFGPTNPLGALIASGEGGYGSFNRGRAGDANGATIDFSQMTVGEVMRRQGLPNGHPDELFAVGKYQMIPGTMSETVERLGIDRNERFTPQLQERMFADYLIDEKRPQVRAYITGETSGPEGLQAAQLALAREFASIADPRTGRSVYDGDSAGNSASISADQVGRALNQMRGQYQENVRAGASPSEAYRALSGDPTQPFVDRPLDPLSDGVLNRGDRGAKVEELQRALTERGFDTRGTDGVFGQNTENAVRAFQTANNLSPVDGIVGANTARALGISLTETQTQPNTPAPQPQQPQPQPQPPETPPSSNAQPVPAGVYREGDTGPGVRALQEALNRNGAQLDADGRFGARTEAAVMAYQRQNGLDVDGVAGAQTIGRLNQGLQQTPPAPNAPNTPTPPSQSEPANGNHWPTPGNFTVNRADKPGEGGGEFGEARSGGRQHRGIDINGNVGDPIEPMRAGRVTFAGNGGAGAGNMIIVDHGGGLETRYMHLDAINVRQGQQVGEDTVIGTMGRTGNTPRQGDTHLHFEVREDGVARDPRLYLNFPDRAVLQEGDQGRDVAKLQEALRGRGATIEADGDFGPATKTAVQAFQRANGLEADGIAGPDTQRALGLGQVQANASPVREVDGHDHSGHNHSTPTAVTPTAPATTTEQPATTPPAATAPVATAPASSATPGEQPATTPPVITAPATPPVESAPQTPRIDQAGHPDNRLYTQAVSNLEQMGPNGGFDSRDQMERAAAALAADAKLTGLTQIDHVARSSSGEGLIAVQGNDPWAPEAKRAFLDVSQATAQTLEQSTQMADSRRTDGPNPAQQGTERSMATEQANPVLIAQTAEQEVARGRAM